MHSRLCAWFNNVSAVVWIGFLSMMQFVLHVTCSCIIMHCIFFPSFLSLVFCCVLLFFSSLFSFLSMAPKKSIPSKNSISRCSSSSSSFPSILDSMRFHDEKAKQDFYDNLIDRAIPLKHQVILSNFPDTSLPIAFSSQGWASLCEIPKRCPSVFI